MIEFDLVENEIDFEIETKDIEFDLVENEIDFEFVS
jgi:hypothetical protein